LREENAAVCKLLGLEGPSTRAARRLARRFREDRLEGAELFDTLGRVVWLVRLDVKISVKMDSGYVISISCVPCSLGPALIHPSRVCLYFNRAPRIPIEYRTMSFSIRVPDGKRSVNVACFDASEIWISRQDYFRPERLFKFNMNLPMLARCHKLEARHSPADEEKDPYLVALIIALAQKQRREAAALRSPATFTVRPPFSLFPFFSEPDRLC
jgi:hypothetical protein